jgi:hypothetical protein
MEHKLAEWLPQSKAKNALRRGRLRFGLFVSVDDNAPGVATLVCERCGSAGCVIQQLLSGEMGRATTRAATTKATGQQLKEKIFHPNSRKACQLERAKLRKGKLAVASCKRSHKQIAKGMVGIRVYMFCSSQSSFFDKVDRYLFFYHVMPPNVPAISLAQLHKIITDTWLKRHDEDLWREQELRYPGRPKTVKEDRILEMQLQDREEYRSGLGLPCFYGV